MTSWVQWILAGSLVTSLAQANDLENILDEGANPATAKSNAAKTAAPDHESPLIFAMKKAIGKINTEQRVFLNYMASAEWDRAVLQFPAAFEGTAFQKSANGRALMGLVQFRAGLPVTGVQTLFLVNNTKDLSPYLVEEWRKTAPADHFVWDLARVAWQPQWREVFEDRVEQRLKVSQVLATPNNFDQLVKLSAELPPATLEKSKVDWQLVVDYSLKDKADQAGKVLAALMKSPKPSVSKDLMQITAARLLFQNGYFDASIKYYEKLAKNSEYWTEAQEEMGWAYLRKGEPNNAMALSQSLVSSNLQYQVSPEAYFVRALSQLKVCDYTGTVESLSLFPKTFKVRTNALKELSADANRPEVLQALAQLKSRKLQAQDLGKNGQVLPRRFARDETLFQFAQAQSHLEQEAKTAEELYAKSLALTGLQGSLESLKKTTLQRAEAAKNSALTRVKDLAQTEVQETQDILRKLHIVEAEVLQQVSLADKIVKNTSGKISDDKKGTTGSKAVANVVRYPAESEVWFDEISNYRVDIKKACTVKR